MKETYKFHYSTECAKNHTHMSYSYQEMIRTLQCRLFRPLFALSTLFGPRNQNFLKITKILGDIIILHQCTKNHDHLMYTSLKIMPTALQVILGQFLSFYSIFDLKLKFSKNEKMFKTY